jgi:hypothetical protein
MKGVAVQDFTEPKQMWKKVRNVLHSHRCLAITAMAVQVNLDEERVKRPELWPSDWILHHDSAPALSVTEMEHPTCSPDLAPNDFWLFKKIIPALK